MRPSVIVHSAMAAAMLALANADNVIVKVMTFNVRTSYAAEDKAATCSNWYGVRKDNVVSQITTRAPDFVGTQETADEQKAYLDGQLAATYKSVGQSSGSLNGKASEVNAIYYRTADWAPISNGMFWLGPNPDAASAAWGMQYYRTAVWGRFKHIKSGVTVCVFNTHFETPGNDEAQTQGAKIIIARRGQYCDPGDKLTVLTGDMNAKPDYPAMKTLTGDGWIETLSQPTFSGNMVSASCQEKFDYTYFRDMGANGCQEKSEVVRDAFNGCYPSDHAAEMSTFCIGTTCCGKTEAPTPAPTPEPTPAPSAQSSASGSGTAEAEIKPGVVVPGGDATTPAPVLGGGTAGAGETQSDSKKATDAGTNVAGTDVSTKSETTTNTTSTVFVVAGVLAAVGGVCAFVIKKKRALEAKLDGEKSVFAPARAMFNREEHDALSPVRRATRAIARKFSSPVPTLELNESDRNRSFSQSSSIPCSRRSSLPISVADDDSERPSSPVMLSYEGRDTERGSSRLYFSEVVTDRAVNNNRNNFALL